MTERQVNIHYQEHITKPFYPELVQFMTSGPLVAMVLEGPNAIKTVRSMLGATNGAEAAPGTIRGDYALGGTENIVHSSDSVQSAKKEIANFFTENEIF